MSSHEIARIGTYVTFNRKLISKIFFFTFAQAQCRMIFEEYEPSIEQPQSNEIEIASRNDSDESTKTESVVKNKRVAHTNADEHAQLMPIFKKAVNHAQNAMQVRMTTAIFSTI